jgi:uncharacterized protein YegL
MRLGKEIVMATTTFTLPGGPGVSITVTDIAGGDLEFTVAVGSDGGQTADLRGLFFHLRNFSSFTNLTVTGDPAVVTDRQFGNNGVIDLGNGANMRGEASPFDIGVEFGTAGIGTGDDVKTATFILSADQDLSLNDIELQQFGARLTSVGTEGGGRNDSLKLVGNAPEVNYPPDAIDDSAAVRANLTQTIDVLANDTDADNDALTVASISGLDPVTEGTAQIVGNKVVFDPAPAFDTLLAGDIEKVVFSYAAQDPGGLTDTADVTVTVVGVNEGTQTDTTNGTLANGQTASISLTTELRTIDDNTDISGTINIGNLATQKFNVVYIIDVSGSTSVQFGGTPVEDQNNDNVSNTVLDAEIAGLRALTQEIVSRGFSDADVDIGLIAFSGGASLLGTFTPSQIGAGGALSQALAGLNEGGGTNFEAPLAQAVSFFNNQSDVATANNLVFFLSDGFGSGNFADEVATLTSAPINAEITAVGVGNSINLAQLNQIDNTGDGNAQQVLDSDTLRTALQDSPLTPATVTGVQLTVNGAPVTATLTSGGPNVFNYSVPDAGSLLLYNNDDAENVVEAIVTFSDLTTLTVNTEIDGRDLSVFGV